MKRGRGPTAVAGFGLLVLLWLTRLGAATAAPLPLSEAMRDIHLWPAMEILEAPAPSLLDDPSAYRFRAVAAGDESLDQHAAAFWVRITAVNPSDRAIKWYLHHQNGLAVGVEPTVVADGRIVAGAVRALHHRSPLFELTTPAHATQQILVRRSAPERLVFRAAEWRAWSPAEFQSYALRDAGIKGAIYGAMIALAAYNLFLFLSLRIGAYGYYVVFALSFTLTWMSWEGLLRRGFLAASWLPALEPTLFASVGCMAAAQFTRLLLETRQRAPTLDRYLRFLLLPFGVGAIAAIAWPWGPKLATALTLPLTTIPIVAAILWRRGFRPARFLLLGSALFTVGGAALVIMQLSNISVVDAPLRLVPALHVLELLLMSFALADRMKLIQQEKFAVEQLHRSAVKRNQQELEAMVRARTVELERARSRAEALARVDPLTGIANRLALLEHGQIELLRAQRHDRPLSVMMIDIDHFKTINDTHGHAAGDAFLKDFAAILTADLRATDRAGRIGGEEFAVVMAETDADAARALAERLRQRIADSVITLGPHTSIHLTASIGVATLEDTDASLGALLRRADGALYQAKKAGRNRVALAPASAGWERSGAADR